MELDQIIEKIISNLQKNGFPSKKVSFPKKSIEDFVSKHDFDLEMVLLEMEDNEIYSKEKGDKILFSCEEWKEASAADLGLDGETLDRLKNMDPELLKRQAEEFFSKMTPEQKQEMEEKVKNLSPEEMEKVMKMKQDLGL